jgi:hypothetical protein
MDVHLHHYRQTSDVLERTEVAKILLIQDFGIVPHYVGRKLSDIQLDGKLFKFLTVLQYPTELFINLQHLTLSCLDLTRPNLVENYKNRSYEKII